MIAIIYTADGPQLQLDAGEAIKALLALPVGDYCIGFSREACERAANPATAIVHTAQGPLVVPAEAIRRLHGA